jgi:hypothetical protein
MAKTAADIFNDIVSTECRIPSHQNGCFITCYHYMAGNMCRDISPNIANVINRPSEYKFLEVLNSTHRI